jgi:hypothetical protein
MVKLTRSIKHYLPYIHSNMEHGLSNARTEATNTHLRVLTRRPVYSAQPLWWQGYHTTNRSRTAGQMAAQK